jgi:TolB protein
MPRIRSEHWWTLRLFAVALLVLSCSTKTNDGGILKLPPPPPPKLSSARIVFTSTRGGTADLYLLNPQDSSVVRLTNNTPVEEAAVISPDSTAIAYMQTVSNHFDVFVMNVDGTNPRNITNDPNADDLVPRWSPDGKQLVFTKFIGSDTNVYTIRRDGTGLTAITNDGGAGSLDWSPGGTRLLLARGDGMWTVGTDGSSPAFIDTVKAATAEYSPDGTHLAITALYTTDYQIFTMPVAGGTKTLVTTFVRDACFGATWSPDGTHIAFMAADYGLPRDVFTIKSDGTDLVNLTNSAAQDLFPSWGPKP